MSELCCGCSCQKSDEPLIETEDGRKWCSGCLRDAWDEMVSAGIVNDFEKLRKLNSDYKHQIHELRKRCESLVREMESLRSALATTESMLMARIKGQCCGGNG